MIYVTLVCTSLSKKITVRVNYLVFINLILNYLKNYVLKKAMFSSHVYLTTNNKYSHIQAVTYISHFCLVSKIHHILNTEKIA